LLRGNRQRYNYSHMAVNSTPNIHTIVICANMFVRKDGKYLVIKRSPAKLDLPNVIAPIGGKIDTNEDPLHAAKREVMEEAGIDVANVRLEAVITEVPHPDDSQYKETWLIFDFSGDYAGGEVKSTEEGELLWLTAQELQQASLYASLKELIGYILDESTGPVFARFSYDAQRNIVGKHISVSTR
jgi:8-oxo-dGTP diphosphatase